MKRLFGSLESAFPPALFLAGLGALAYGALARTGVRRWVVVAYLVWTIAELPVTFRRSPGETGGEDRGSMQLYGLARAGVVAGAVFAPVGSGWYGWQSGALVLFAAGIALRLGAIVRLGPLYSHRVRTLTDHRIVSTGPYRFIRHPAYAGMLLSNAAFVAVFANPFGVAAFVGLLVPAVVNRIVVEERTLMQLDGYAAYAHGRKRLVPAVW